MGPTEASLKTTPILPFGTRVLAHLPLKLQTALSGRAFDAIYVGRAPGVKGAIKLFNPSSKRIILRRTFKVLGPSDFIYPDPLARTHIEISEEEGIDQLLYDSVLDRAIDVSEPSVKNSGVSTTSSKKKKEIGSITYRSVLRSEVPKLQRFYFSKIGMQFLDIATGENLKIIDIVRCTSTRGAGSKKIFYKMYDLVKFPGSPISFSDFEYQPCAEVISSTDTRWDDAANNVSLIAMSAAFSYHDAHRDHFHNLTWGEESFCTSYADFHSSPLLQANRADFLDTSSQPPP